MCNPTEQSAPRIEGKLREVLEKNRDSFSADDLAALTAAIDKLEETTSAQSDLRKAKTIDLIILLLQVLVGSGLVGKVVDLLK
ncbi:MAG TPA: hypothetical protein VHI13_03595 [Candidatus Kapabacteria bacterium]|nr:hypothetical protein [Candidatus Kapabacteria bacterium]